MPGNYYGLPLSVPDGMNFSKGAINYVEYFDGIRAPNGVYLTEKAANDLMRIDAKALWLLADQSIPTDIKEMAARWKMSEVVQEMWRNAFMAGWRAAHQVPDEK
jgi:hypothetical protein